MPHTQFARLQDALRRRWQEVSAMPLPVGPEFMNRFLPLLDGSRLHCGDVLALCRKELDALTPEPSEGWLSFAYEFARNRMFPEHAPPPSPYDAGAVFFLSVLQTLMDEERRILPPDPVWQLDILRKDELAGSPYQDSYRRYLYACRDEFVYEMMRLGLETTSFRTLEHIAGVHHVALTVARGLKASGAPVDLALVSAAASGHDIGKFGCRPGERVPYLHYYYTDLWFSRHHMDDVGYVAANHSVWDLELDYLSAESLILIYADFRVKQDRAPNGQEITRISTLEQAFDVILKKLDNMTEEKQRRYTFVYAKLRDFERYMVQQGVDVTLSGAPLNPQPQHDIALMDKQEAIERLKLLSVGYNIRLMHQLTGNNLLEQARGVTDWKELRVYLGIFRSYSVYLSVRKKMETLSFLYELMMHREGGIRRQAAVLMGEIIARFHAGYAKEKPKDYIPPDTPATDLGQWAIYLEKMIHPDKKLLVQRRRWITFTMKFMVNALLEVCAPDRRATFLDIFLKYYQSPNELGDEAAFQLLETAVALPLAQCNGGQRDILLQFAAALASRPDLTVRAATALLLGRLGVFMEDKEPALSVLRDMDCAGSPSLSLLRQRTAAVLSGTVPGPSLDENTLSDIFLDNLKTATPWILKDVNIQLLEGDGRKDGGLLLHIAAHLTNLVEVSDRATIQRRAGAALLHLAPKLSVDRRNEIAVELCRGLESGQQERSRYIPEYLGQLSMWLPPAQLEETIASLNEYLCAPSGAAAVAALDTVGVMYECYGAYRQRYQEPDETYCRRGERLLGMLLKGLAGYQEEVRQEAMYVLEQQIFASVSLSSYEKRQAFLLIIKKLLALVGEGPEDELSFYYRCALLGCLSRFAAQQELLYGGFRFDPPRPIAFFPGTFDPFTLSHKAIAQAIRDKGYEVMLAIDEFSWSKKTQPSRIRRAIAGFSVADEFHIHLFPEDFPVNIANPQSLRALRKAFPGQALSIVAGSDVVANASCYRYPPRKNSIHSFDHLLIRRGDEAVDTSMITGRVEFLTLPPHLEEISSTQLREAVDQGRDISDLVDPVAEEYIRHQGLYLREPSDKPLLQTEELTFRHLTEPSEDVEAILSHCALPDTSKALCRAVHRAGDHILLLCQGQETLGLACFRLLDSRGLYARLGSTSLTALVRQSSGGRTLLLSGIYVPPGPKQPFYAQTLLTETLTAALRREYIYALHCPLMGEIPDYVRDVLTLQGFTPVQAREDYRPLYAVDMSRPIVLTHNMDKVIKAPLSDSSYVADAVATAHRKLQKVLTTVYPGSLVLSMSAGVIHHRLLQAITACNNVPAVPVEPRLLGECLCVPYGKLLRGMAVPNTVTKTIHTDKVYQPDLSSYSIEAYPNYAPLPCQVRTIRAFDRPVILVDDMLHDGKRIRRLAPLLREVNTPIRKVLVGYLTGMGRDLMEEMGIPAEGVYYLPNLRLRFTESTLYPFIGGDAIAGRSVNVLQPAINRILPYAAPDMAGDGQNGSAYRLSRCCLENARDILMALEREYRVLYERNLTLGRLSEAVVLPLCPDKGKFMTYDPGRAASSYLEEDIEHLERLRGRGKMVIEE